jgi:cyclin-dependent kinase 6
MGLPYATPVDLWACGCIMAELYLRKPLFDGRYEMDQLNTIFSIIGLPSEQDWPADACVLRSNFKENGGKDFAELIPELDKEGKDLLEVREREREQIKMNGVWFSFFFSSSDCLV